MAEFSVGECTRWIDRGYGFLLMETGESVFVHINCIENGAVPFVGDLLAFKIRINPRKNKTEAYDARIIKRAKPLPRIALPFEAGEQR